MCDQPKRHACAALPFCDQSIQLGATELDQGKFGRDEKGVQQNQNADGDELEEERQAPTPGALVLGGISSSNHESV